MPFETIENLKPAKLPATPDRGVHVGMRGTPETGRGFIAISIGAELAKELGLRAAEEPVRLMVGKGSDAGKIAVSHDQGGAFIARGKPGKSYRIAIGLASAAGLFARKFAPFKADRLEVLKPAGNGVCKQFVFRAPAEFLAADD